MLERPHVVIAGFIFAAIGALWLAKLSPPIESAMVTASGIPHFTHPSIRSAVTEPHRKGAPMRAVRETSGSESSGHAAHPVDGLR